ncbi:uncharacterized protein METZ01_LOCUS227859, partial [marine metagenome]
VIASDDVEVIVTPVEDPPVADDQEVITDEDVAVEIVLTGSDPDLEDEISFVLLTDPADGSLTGEVPYLIYTPNENWYGIDSFTFSVSDDVSSDTATVSITVVSVNDVPVLTDIGPQATNEDTAKVILLSATDIEGDSITFYVESDNADVTAEITGGDTLMLTPSEEYYGTANITVTVSDSASHELGLTDSETFVLMINLVLDIPVIIGQEPLTIFEDTPLEVTLNHLLVTDTDNVYPFDFTLTVLDSDSNNINYDVDGNTIIPFDNFTGDLTVPIILSDGDNDVSFDLLVSVTPINDNPVINFPDPTYIFEDFILELDLNFYASDADGDPLTFTAGSDNDSVTVNVSGDSLTVTPAENYFNTTGINIIVTVMDIFSEEDSDTLSLIIESVNDAPVITAQGLLETSEESSLEIVLGDLFVTDIDNTYPGNFALTVLEGENYTVISTTITPALDFNGELTVPVYVDDGGSENSQSTPVNLTVGVTPVNDAPLVTSV